MASVRSQSSPGIRRSLRAQESWWSWVGHSMSASNSNRAEGALNRGQLEPDDSARSELFDDARLDRWRGQLRSPALELAFGEDSTLRPALPPLPAAPWRSHQRHPPSAHERASHRTPVAPAITPDEGTRRPGRSRAFPSSVVFAGNARRRQLRLPARAVARTGRRGRLAPPSGSARRQRRSAS